MKGVGCRVVTVHNDVAVIVNGWKEQRTDCKKRKNGFKRFWVIKKSKEKCVTFMENPVFWSCVAYFLKDCRLMSVLLKIKVVCFSVISHVRR